MIEQIVMTEVQAVSAQFQSRYTSPCVDTEHRARVDVMYGVHFPCGDG